MTRGSEWLGFTALCVGMFMAILDIQVVAAALPRISQALHISLDQLSWIQTAYLITEVIAIALSGRLTRALSTRGIFTLGVAGFVIASLGCAFSRSFIPLIAWRAVQGFCGGVIIPTAFAAGYKMFPKRLQSRAILLAGGMAMLAPSLGPLLGGYIAQKLAWNWLFLINIPIGVAVAAVVAARIRIDNADRRAWRTIDVPALTALAASLALLMVLLKVAPGDHWMSGRDLYLTIGTLAAAIVLVRRCIGTPEALVDFSPLRAGSFSAACILNFALGLGLYGSIYLLPLFLGFVRYHSPLQIGLIMTVTGVAQLVAAPLATLADKRFPAVAVAAFGFGLFGLGAFANIFETPRTDFSELFWPQVLRGAAVLFCILPITNVALDAQPAAQLANASGLLNLIRNIGGAVGIGLVDTIVNVRPTAIASELVSGLTHGSRRIAEFVGLPVDLVAGQAIANMDPSDLAIVRPVVARAAATLAFNEGWLLLCSLMTLSLLALPLLRRASSGLLRSLGVAVLAATFCCENTAFAQASALPRLEADSFSGKHVVLPDDAGGKPIVLVLGFARESEEALNTWAHKLLAAVGPRAQIYVVIVADSAPFFAKGKVKKKIAGSALATQTQLEDNVLVTFRGEGWRDLVPAGPGKDAGIVVADTNGDIVFAKREPYSDEALADAAKAVP